MTAIPEAARRKIAAPQPVIVSKRRSRESNDPDWRSPPDAPSPYTPISIPKNLRDSIPGSKLLIPVRSPIHRAFFHFFRSANFKLFFGSPRLGFQLPDFGNFGHFGNLSPPHPLFSDFCCKQTTSAIRRLRLPCVALGWPLGHAWATQGPPKPRPNPKPSPQVPAEFILLPCLAKG